MSLHDLERELSVAGFQTMLAVHAVLVLSACWLALSRRTWTTVLAWIAVIGSGLLWFGVNGRWEGRVLHSFSPTHGLTEADLVVPGLIGAALVVRGLRFAGRGLQRMRRERIRAGVPTAFRTMWPKAPTRPSALPPTLRRPPPA